MLSEEVFDLLKRQSWLSWELWHHLGALGAVVYLALYLVEESLELFPRHCDRVDLEQEWYLQVEKWPLWVVWEELKFGWGINDEEGSSERKSGMAVFAGGRKGRM